MKPAIYRYPFWTLISLYGAMIASFAVLIIFGSYLITKGQIDKSYLYIGGFCIALSLLSLYSVTDLYRKHLAILIDTNGISTVSLWGRKLVPWDAICRIERRRAFDPVWNKHRNIYYVIDPNNRIRFDEALKDLRSLLDQINVNIQKYNIDTLLIDLGRDTRRQVYTSVADDDERRKLMREGVRTRGGRL